MEKAICPKCEKDDQTQKVTSVINAKSTTDNSVFRTTISQTELARRLAPPIRKINWVSCLTTLLISFFVILLSYYLASKIENQSFKFIVYGIVGLSGSVFILIKLNQINKPQGGVAYKNPGNWLQLYYCYRDDCVFDPKTNKYTSSENMDELLQ